jgi:hypothetical protein
MWKVSRDIGVLFPPLGIVHFMESMLAIKDRGDEDVSHGPSGRDGLLCSSPQEA